MSEASSHPRRRLSRLLAEIVSVIFAVLVALAADEWWEERDQAAEAERMTESIVQEIRGNRHELLNRGDGPSAEEVAAALDSTIALLREDEEPEGLSVDWNVALLSSAAWDAAQISGATRYMQLDLLIDLARVYEFQRLYGETQDQLVSLIADVPSRMDSEPLQTLVALRSRLAVATNLRSTLATIYACRLVGIEGPEAPEAADCPTEPQG